MPKKRMPTWKEAARLLNHIQPRIFTTSALGKIFRKSGGTVWWALHPELRRELDRDRDKSPKRREQKRLAQRRYKANLSPDGFQKKANRSPDVSLQLSKNGAMSC